MTSEFFFVLFLAALCFLIAVATLLAILILASRFLAQGLMSLLAQLFGGNQGGVTDPEGQTQARRRADSTRPDAV